MEHFVSDKFDREWALGQLSAAQVSLPVGNAVVKLTNVWNDLPKDLQTEEVLKLFVSLAKGEPIALDNEEWVGAEAGFLLSKGTLCRVAPNAFQGSLGKIHNGRLVRVVDRRWGNIVADSVDGKNPELRGAHYPPNVLQIKSSK